MFPIVTSHVCRAACNQNTVGKCIEKLGQFNFPLSWTKQLSSSNNTLMVASCLENGSRPHPSWIRRFGRYTSLLKQHDPVDRISCVHCKTGGYPVGYPVHGRSIKLYSFKSVKSIVISLFLKNAWNDLGHWYSLEHRLVIKVSSTAYSASTQSDSFTLVDKKLRQLLWSKC